MFGIADFKEGMVLRLVDFGSTAYAYRRRLLALGVVPGAEMKLIRKAPLGCPLQMEVRGTSLALRKEEACHLLWEPV